MAIATDNVKSMQGYTLHTIQTTQYKTNTLVLKMKAPLSEKSVTQRSLLPYVLQASTKNYPTTPQLRSYLDELYGASFYVDVGKKGEYDVISFTMEIANEKFLSDPAPLLEKGFALLADILLKPNSTDTAFDELSFTNEKRSLKQRIQSLFDDKMRFASTRLIEEMCQGEPYSLETLGNNKDLEAITAESLYSYYKQAIAEDEIDLYVIGDVEQTQVEQFADRYLQLEPRQPVQMRSIQKDVVEAKEVLEKDDVKQGKLNIGYRTQIVYGDPDYYALQVFNGIFGGFSHSKLFINVREKASLAYYAASRLESHKGLLIVMSGIETANYRQAVQIISEQMKAMKNGEFSEQELEQTKAVIRNQILETIDSPRGLVEILYHNVIAKIDIPLEKWLQATEKITKSEIVEAGKKIELDTVYFLTGTEVPQ
ncbi:pitrilysin family protein [Peribacillus sp. FSL H8-0477]|uniref:EF-P 5-aminopentanol modification-associated protein YfmF n=1 Tax=Peribacillus sp. FSL H8-0477 TaxID=2921388 RepID=UPI0030FA5522